MTIRLYLAIKFFSVSDNGIHNWHCNYCNHTLKSIVNLPKGEVLPSLGIVEEDTVHFPSP